MQTLLRDVSYTLRQLRNAPSFALTTILTLTMAITVNVVVFGVVNALLLHPLPVPQAQQLLQIQGRDAMNLTVSYPNYRDIQERNRTFADTAIYRVARIGVGIDGVAQPVWGYEASGNYFDMLGVKPALGCFFHPEDDVKVDGSPVAVLSYACWQVRFSGDPHIVGKTVQLNKHPYTVLGVAPKNFNGTERFLWPELWVPYHDQPEIEGNNNLEMRMNNNSWVVGRLRPGVTAVQADADLARVAAQLGKDYPQVDTQLTLRTASAGLLGDGLGKPMRAFLIGVMLLALLVLLAACTNLGGLFAARTADRAKELGIRIAIGSSRWSIVRQLLTESVTIAVIGGAAAAMLSTLLLHALAQWRPANLEIPLQLLVEPDAMVYVVAALFALLTGVVFGLVPMRQVWRTDPNETLKAAGSTGYREHRFAARHVLLAAQIALCCLLVTSAAVALRGLRRTFVIPLGFHPEHVVLATLDLHLGGYDDKASAAVQQQLLNAMKAIPGVSGAAYSNNTPLSIDQSNTSIFAPGTTDFNLANAKFNAQVFHVSPDYFAVAETQILAGRAFTQQDDDNAPRVAVVNATFARRLFGTVDAVGKSFPSYTRLVTVVGVVEDGKYVDLTEPPTPAIFWPIEQHESSDTVLLVRSERSPAELLAAVRSAIASVDAGMPIFNLYTWEDALSFVTFPARAATAALGILGLLAILLAVTGIFGQANYTVSRRMRELGIRVALGAQSEQVLRAALGRMAWLLGIGSAVGLLLGVAASRLLASVVYQATAADPTVIGVAAVTMLLLGMVAAAIPARRALYVDPAILLREE